MSSQQHEVAPLEVDPDPYRVLVVEDDRSQALFAEAILRGAGMQAEVVAIPERMMEAMERFNPDLVLMDLHMPGTSGTSLTSHIREHPRFGHTPVVFLTGDQDPERQLEALEHGGDDYILKPVRPRHLIVAVQSRVRRARAFAKSQKSVESDRHPITGLYTRPALLKSLASVLAAGTPGGVLLVEMGNAIALRGRYGYAAFESLLNEAGRMLGIGTAAVQSDRLQAALDIARRYNALTVLKGCGSIIAAPDGRWFINTSGHPGMASAGMGDVLTGLVAGLLAQGWPAESALIAAVHLHGAAADRLAREGTGPIGLSAGETIVAARGVFNGWLIEAQQDTNRDGQRDSRPLITLGKH